MGFILGNCIVFTRVYYSNSHKSYSKKCNFLTQLKNFYPWFYYLLLPLVTLLFVAIFRRINEYGITEKRYFIVVIAVWILAMIIYMLFSKTKKNRVFPLSLAVPFFINFFRVLGCIFCINK